MKNLLLSLFLILALPALAISGEWKFNDFNMAKLEQYYGAGWFTLAGGDNGLGFNVNISPTVCYESEKLPSACFLSVGQGAFMNMENQGQTKAVTVFDVFGFGHIHLGFFKPTDELGKGDFLKNWGLKGGLGVGF